MRKYPNLTAPLIHHWTETDPRVLAYVAEAFQGIPENQDHGPDLRCNGITIEVKSCLTWVKAIPEYCRGARRRRGKFKIEGYECADFYLFVLVDQEDLHMRMIDAVSFHAEFGPGPCVIRWPLIFDGVTDQAARSSIAVTPQLAGAGYGV